MAYANEDTVSGTVLVWQPRNATTALVIDVDAFFRNTLGSWPRS